ncbi:MAG: carbon monoxide dehydrogenase subunit G [Pseudomonadota bacterium]
MELTGEHTIPAPRTRVWEALHDPVLLKECITGCQSLEMSEDGTLKAKITAKVGPVKATFDADVEIVNSNPPESYTLQGAGKGGVAGFAKGSADVALAEVGEATVLTYHAKASVGGKLAQLGSRLVDSTAKRYAADFFTAFCEKLSADAAPAPEAAPAPVAEPAAEPAPAPAAQPAPPQAAPMPAAAAPKPAPALSAPSSGGGQPLVWLIVAVVAAVAGFFLFFNN